MTGETKLTKFELGDYQTPVGFCHDVCYYLRDKLKLSPTIIIEPTCGLGNFLSSAILTFSPQKTWGIEIDQSKIDSCRKLNLNANLIHANFFSFCWDIIKNELVKHDDILIVGNPPWVTNSALSTQNSNNVPTKSNFKKHTGFNALTGSSNFDICESIILTMISEFNKFHTTIALLCKMSVARNVFIEIQNDILGKWEARILKFDGEKIFSVSTECCLLVLSNTNIGNVSVCQVSDISNPELVTSSIGYLDGKLYSDINSGDDFGIDGNSCFSWRQGIKHDCAKVMELKKIDSETYVNGLGEKINIEEELVYPLLKSSMTRNYLISSSQKYVIVTQKKINQDTSEILAKNPLTSQYLNRHKSSFIKRKSSIYKTAPDFSIFGIGDYSFAKYKVAISGFYKKPIFSLIKSEKPIMLDDTCYFISFENHDEAYVIMLLLNSRLVENFLKKITFQDSKRPYTKKVLSRINFKSCFERLKFMDLRELENELKLPSKLTIDMYESCKEKVSSMFLF